MISRSNFDDTCRSMHTKWNSLMKPVRQNIFFAIHYLNYLIFISQKLTQVLIDEKYIIQIHKDCRKDFAMFLPCTGKSDSSQD